MFYWIRLVSHHIEHRMAVETRTECMAKKILTRMRFTRCVLPQGQASTFVNCILFLMCNILFAPVLYWASINESSASHLRSDHERILWLSDLISQAASLLIFPPSLFLSFLIHFQLTPARLHFSISLFIYRIFPVANAIFGPLFY